MNTSDNILIFDGVCNLCNTLVMFIIRHDRFAKIRFTPSQSNNGQLLLERFKVPDISKESVIFIRNNQLFLRSSAILHVMKELGGVWRLFYLFIILPESFRDLFYNQVARSRYRIFGRRDKCMVPDQDIRDRFL